MINKTRRGFTLIEILIVVAIIAILASVVLVGLGPTQRAGRDARRISDLRQTQTGLELYYSKCGFYPGTAALAACGAANNAAATTWAAMSASLTGSSIGVNQIPNDPNTAATYFYGTPGASANTYTIGATLEDVNNQALNSDLDGNSNGVACGTAGPTDNVYCLSL